MQFYQPSGNIFSIKMEVENIKIRIEEIMLRFGIVEKIIYIIIFGCENTESPYEWGCISFQSDDRVKWKCTHRNNKICNLKLDHIFTDTMLSNTVQNMSIQIKNNDCFTSQNLQF